MEIRQNPWPPPRRREAEKRRGGGDGDGDGGDQFFAVVSERFAPSRQPFPPSILWWRHSRLPCLRPGPMVPCSWPFFSIAWFLSRWHQQDTFPPAELDWSRWKPENERIPPLVPWRRSYLRHPRPFEKGFSFLHLYLNWFLWFLVFLIAIAAAFSEFQFYHCYLSFYYVLHFSIAVLPVSEFSFFHCNLRFLWLSVFSIVIWTWIADPS